MLLTRALCPMLCALCPVPCALRYSSENSAIVLILKALWHASENKTRANCSYVRRALTLVLHSPELCALRPVLFALRYSSENSTMVLILKALWHASENKTRANCSYVRHALTLVLHAPELCALCPVPRALCPKPHALCPALQEARKCFIL